MNQIEITKYDFERFSNQPARVKRVHNKLDWKKEFVYMLFNLICRVIGFMFYSTMAIALIWIFISIIDTGVIHNGGGSVSWNFFNVMRPFFN